MGVMVCRGRKKGGMNNFLGVSEVALCYAYKFLTL